VKVLRKLQPRLYSIASSPKAHPSSVHLTVAAVRYESKGRKREGVCSTFLSDRADAAPVPVFVHSAKHFRVPEDLSTPVIMVGPGTGIAPFRAFLQERKAAGSSGKNWLFFGDQKAETDFLYREELEAYQAEGVLHELSVAFSRDQAEKIYVQHRMLERAADLYAWLESGAYFYICGDASRMAKDVDTALHKVVETAGGKSPEEAAAYVEELKKSKRYRKDVY
jgi:sulfite reductase (NADPH) flavoprotein alpha-component